MNNKIFMAIIGLAMLAFSFVCFIIRNYTEVGQNHITLFTILTVSTFLMSGGIMLLGSYSE